MIDLARELLELKRLGVIANLWIDAGRVRISYPRDPNLRHYITDPWGFVARMRRRVA